MTGARPRIIRIRVKQLGDDQLRKGRIVVGPREIVSRGPT